MPGGSNAFFMALALGGAGGCAALTGLGDLNETGSCGDACDGGSGSDAHAVDDRGGPRDDGAPLDTNDAARSQDDADATSAPDGDASSLADASSDEAGAPLVNLAVNGDMETACDGPGGVWSAWQGSLTTDTTAHTGALSCRVCKAPTFTQYSIDEGTGFVNGPVAGQAYRAQAWVRLVPAVTTTTQVAYAHERVYASGSTLEAADSPALPLTPVWQLLRIDHQLTSSGTSLNIYFSIESGLDGDCFLVDDIALYQLQ